MAINKVVYSGTTLIDLTDTTAVESDVAQGKKFHKADGTLATGTSEGGGGGGGGGGSATDALVFYDYDGTIVTSYNRTDALALSALPANPTHSGLTAQGWNWSLANIKSYLTKYPEAVVNVGQMYITDDGKTRLYVHFEEARKHPYVGLGVNGTVVIDWGDNSEPSTLTGTSLTTVVHTDHEYASGGDYVITIKVTSGSFRIFGTSSIAHLLKKDTTTTANIQRVYANALQKIELGENVEIYNYAFNGCYSLSSITIPDGVTSIGSYAFNYCYSLSSITIPDGVTSIGNYAFQYCTSLSSIIIPDSVTSIGTKVFDGCYSLSSITIPDGVTSIGSYAFNGCYSLSSITIPDGVTSIRSYAFNYCYSLSSITIPDGVTSIGSYAFNYCHSLSSINIPDGVTSVGTYTFQNCYTLSSITIPDGVTSIGGYAFNNCQGMKEYHFLPTTPPTLSNTNAFNNIQSDCIMYVPVGSLEAYQTATNWSSVASYMREEDS